ncbi:hypothetical protein ABPG72_012020 [Tetrahymena utriculariae]
MSSKKNLNKKFTVVQSKKSQKNLSASSKQIEGLRITQDEDNNNINLNQKSLHEALIYEYLSKTKMEGILLNALKSTIKDDLIPKNPYCSMSRSLIASNLKSDLVANFENLAKLFRKNPVAKEGAYKLTSVSFQNTTKIYGLKHILELIDMPRFSLFFDAIDDLLPDYKIDSNNVVINISNSISGGLIFKSELFPYASSHSKDLEIFCEVFINCGSVEQAIDSFAKFILQDIISISDQQNQHIIKEFVFYSYNQEASKKYEKKGWKIQDIITDQNSFMSDIKRHVQNQQQIYFKGYMKIIRFEDGDRLQGDEQDNTSAYHSRPSSNSMLERNGETRGRRNNTSLNKNLYQYIEVYKSYNLHFTKNQLNKQEIFSFGAQPLGSLLKGVFVSYEACTDYAKFFYQPTQSYFNSKDFGKFVDSQLRLVYKYWQDQNIMACSWELLYMALAVQDDDLRRNLVDSIIQILSSDLSGLVALSKSNQIIRAVMDLYNDTSTNNLKFVISSSYKVYKQKLLTIYAKASNSDILRNREFVYLLFKEIEDEHGEMNFTKKTTLVLKTLHTVTKYTGLGNLQQVGSLVKNVPDYINQTLKKRKFISENEDTFITYDQFLEKKQIYKVLDVKSDVLEFKRSAQGRDQQTQDIEDKLILTYFDRYDVYDTLYIILREVFFGQQLPNPIPSVILKVEAKALKYQIFEVKGNKISETVLREFDESDQVDSSVIKNATPNVYQYRSQKMNLEQLNPVYGLKDALAYTAFDEMSMRYKFLKVWIDISNNPLKRRVPEAYQLDNFIAVSTYNLFQHSQITKRPYIEWNFCQDVVIRGPNEIQAQNIFYDLLLTYVLWLNNQPNLVVIGFFTESERIKPVLSIESILKDQNTDSIRFQLAKIFDEGERIYLKIITDNDQRFKVVVMSLNFIFLGESNMETKSLLNTDNPDTYLRVFFEKDSILKWYKIFEYKDKSVKKLIIKEQKRLFYIGSLNMAMKLELCKIYINYEQPRYFIRAFRILYSMTEQLFNFSKEAENFILIFSYILYKQPSQVGFPNQQSQKKYTLDNIKAYFYEWNESLKKLLYNYDNIYFESLSPTVINQLNILELAFDSKSKKIKDYQTPLLKIAGICSIMADSLILTHKNLLSDDYDFDILWG